jgi:hypothetical protein
MSNNVVDMKEPRLMGARGKPGPEGKCAQRESHAFGANRRGHCQSIGKINAISTVTSGI